jgi:hypothetical protein
MANLDDIILEWKDTQKQLKALSLAIESDGLIENQDIFQSIKQKIGKEIQIRFARVINTELNKVINGRTLRVSNKKYLLIEKLLIYVIKKDKIHEKLKLALLDSDNFFKNEKNNIWVISDKYLFLINSIKTHLVHHFIKIEDDATMLEIIMSKVYNQTIDKVINHLGQVDIKDDYKLIWGKMILEIHHDALGIRYPTHHLEDTY